MPTATILSAIASGSECNYRPDLQQQRALAHESIAIRRDASVPQPVPDGGVTAVHQRPFVQCSILEFGVRQIPKPFPLTGPTQYRVRLAMVGIQFLEDSTVLVFQLLML